MKETLTRLINYYNTNTTFHSFILGVEMTLGSFLAESLASGVPTTKNAWRALGVGALYALWGWWKRWSAQNVATVGVEISPTQQAKEANK